MVVGVEGPLDLCRAGLGGLVGAAQRMRAPGAAHLDQDDVAVAVNTGERHLDFGGQGGGPTARAAHEGDERIGQYLPRGPSSRRLAGRDDDDVQGDLTALAGPAVLEDFVGSAAGRHPVDLAGPELEARRRSGRADRGDGDREQE